MNDVERNFVLITLYAYLGCLVMTILGMPPIGNIAEILQLIFYIVIVCVYTGAVINELPTWAYGLLGCFYGMAAMFAYTGYIEWVNYAGAQDLHGIAMAVWDLILAMIFIGESMIFIGEYNTDKPNLTGLRECLTEAYSIVEDDDEDARNKTLEALDKAFTELDEFS